MHTEVYKHMHAFAHEANQIHVCMSSIFDRLKDFQLVISLLPSKLIIIIERE